jgi:hypothetical protein
VVQHQTLHTLKTKHIRVDPSFVQARIFDCYDPLLEATKGRQIITILNSAFQPYNIEFAITPIHPGLGPHSDALNTAGIHEGGTYTDGSIVISLYSTVGSMLNDVDLPKFIRMLSAVISHELVHREQLIRSNKKIHQQNRNRNAAKFNTWQLYYSDPHEHLPFAYEIIEQLKQRNWSKGRILQEIATSRNNNLCRLSSRYDEFYYVVSSLSGKRDLLKRLKKLMYQVLSV